MLDKARSLEVAKIITDQLGGTRLLVLMIGAKHFLALSEGRGGITFQHMRGAGYCSFTRIKLAADDTYTVEVGSSRAGKVKILHTAEGVYCDVLRETVERFTGLTLTMPRIIGLTA